MIAQQFDLFGTGDAPTTSRKPTRGTVNTGQGALFQVDAYDLVDTSRKPAETPDLRADLHTDELPLTEDTPAVAVGDRFSDPNLLGSPCVVTEVDPDGAWFEARWTPGAPAHRYPTSHATRWTKVAPPADDRPEVVDVADLTDDDIAHLAAGATVVDDAYLAARQAALTADDADDDGFSFAGLTRADVAALREAADEPTPAPAADPGALVVSTRRVASSSGHRDYRYIGLIRRGRRGPIVAECGHEHTNRTDSTKPGGRSAVDCAYDVLEGAADPAIAEHVSMRWADRWQALTRGTGHTYTAETIAKTRAASAADAQAYLAAVEAARAAM